MAKKRNTRKQTTQRTKRPALPADNPQHQGTPSSPADEQPRPDPLGLDPGAAQSGDPANADARRRPKAPDNETRTCPYHKELLKSNNSTPFFTRYYCPNEGCTYSEKVPRPDVKQQRARAEAAEQDYSAR